MDQPTIDGLNTWFVSKAARELGLKVAISGLGGDELFGGYPSFRDVPLCVRALAIPALIPGLGDAARRLLTRLGRVSHVWSPKAAGLLKYGGTYAGAYLLRRGLFMPWELESVIGAEMARLGLRRLKPASLHRRSAEAQAEDPLRQSRRARVIAVHAQSAAARHRLGQHGTFSRSAGSAGRCGIAAPIGGDHRDRRVQIQASARDQSTASPPV